MIEQHGIRCPECGDEIYSNSRHDFVECKCKRVFIDGGFDYSRVGFTDKEPIRISREVDKTKIPTYFFLETND